MHWIVLLKCPLEHQWKLVPLLNWTVQYRARRLLGWALMRLLRLLWLLEYSLGLRSKRYAIYSFIWKSGLTLQDCCILLSLKTGGCSLSSFQVLASLDPDHVSVSVPYPDGYCSLSSRNSWKVESCSFYRLRYFNMSVHLVYGVSVGSQPWVRSRLPTRKWVRRRTGPSKEFQGPTIGAFEYSKRNSQSFFLDLMKKLLSVTRSLDREQTRLEPVDLCLTLDQPLLSSPTNHGANIRNLLHFLKLSQTPESLCLRGWRYSRLYLMWNSLRDLWPREQYPEPGLNYSIK